MITRSLPLPLRLAGVAASLLLVGTGCGSTTTSTTSPTTTPGVDQPATPSVEQLDVSVVASTATAVAIANGVRGGRVLIDWGDGNVTEVTDGLPLVNAQHEYLESSAHTVTVTAVDPSGRTAVAIGTADVTASPPTTTTAPSTTVAPTTAPPTTAPPTTTPPTTAPPTTARPTTAPPTTAPPTTTPPPTTPPLPPLPDPVVVEADLTFRQVVTFIPETTDSVIGTAATSTRTSTSSFELESTAGFVSDVWATAGGQLVVGVETLAYFPDLPDDVDEIEVLVDWKTTVTDGQLFAPVNHLSTFDMNVGLSALGGAGLVDTDTFGVLDQTNEGGSGRDIIPVEQDGGGQLTVTTSRTAPVAEFVLFAQCGARRDGAAAFGVGLCQSGNVDLERLTFTLTPIRHNG